MTKDEALKLALEALDNDSDSDDAWHQRLDAKTAIKEALAQPEQEPVAIDGNTSDGYHTFNELYEFRKAYNAALFNEWAAGNKCSVHKSWRHHDGELCFGGGWFIVVAVLPDGQISNHYEAKDWDLFAVPETERALFEFDGHTGADVVERLKAYTTSPAQPAPVQHFDHTTAANSALRDAQNRSYQIAKLSRPQNCGTGYCSCVECVMEPAAQPAPVKWSDYEPDGVHHNKPAPVQEPVAWMDIDEKGAMSGLRYWSKPDNRHEVALYTTPPAAQRSWVGLTADEIHDTLKSIDPETKRLPPGFKAFAIAIEAKLKEKNT